MPHEMKGFSELKQFNEKKRDEMSESMNVQRIKAAVAEKTTVAGMSDKEKGRRIAYAYAKSLYLSGLSGDRRL